MVLTPMKRDVTKNCRGGEFMRQNLLLLPFIFFLGLSCMFQGGVNCEYILLLNLCATRANEERKFVWETYYQQCSSRKHTHTHT